MGFIATKASTESVSMNPILLMPQAVLVNTEIIAASTKVLVSTQSEAPKLSGRRKAEPTQPTLTSILRSTIKDQTVFVISLVHTK